MADARSAEATGAFAGLRAVLANPGLRRVILAYTGFNFGEWASWIAILVFAFERGGATEAGVVALVQLIPAAIVAPFAAGLADRFPRERVLLGSYLAQGIAMGVTALALVADAPSPLVYLFATATATSVTLTRPAHGSILPSLSMTPAELTAANVASETVQNVSILIAPAVAGLLLALAGAGAVFLVTASGVLASALLVTGVRTEIAGLSDAGTPVTPVSDEVARSAGAARLQLAELAGGFATLGRLAGPRTIVALIGAGTIIEGALDVLIVVLALDLLDAGETAVGFLNSAVGAGGLIGAAVAATLVGRTRLAAPFAIGLLLWGVPLVIIGLLPIAVAAFALLLVSGAGRSIMGIAGRTLLQRAAPDRALARVFGVLEGLHMAMLGLGSVFVPILIGLTGPRQALVLAGLWIPAVLLLTWRALRAVDAAAVVHVRELALLRGIPLFAPLSPPMVERLSATLVPVFAPAGSWIIRQGESGDRYYIIDAGTAEVYVDGQPVRTEGPGDSFGEIALIRDIPRTASVRATSDLRLLALERGIFLAAVSGRPESRASADAVAAELLAKA
jgi:Cyclic nucleotide-binding domain/Major Facilitator Superfamily